MGEGTAGERQPIANDERLLTEVDHILHHQTTDGQVDPLIRQHILINLRTAVEEATQPYTVSQTEHEVGYDQARQTRTFMWLGKSAMDAAISGYAFHEHREARRRVAIEVDEAIHAEQDLRPGVMKFFISPRMTRTDASYVQAKQEHLADDDAVRASWLQTDQHGNVVGRQLRSLLVRDVPLSAWVAMLKDPNNIFGKAITVRDERSATSVMEVHRELELPMYALPNGPLGLVEAVVPYITDTVVRERVNEHIALFAMEQAELRSHTETTAERWYAFELELANSLQSGKATTAVKSFIFSLQHNWDAPTLRLIQNHQYEDEVIMTRQLAAVLEGAKRNSLLGAMVALSGDKRVTAGVDPFVIQQIRDNQMLMQMMHHNAMDYQELEAQTARLIARVNLKPEGGCTVTGRSGFKNEDSPEGGTTMSNETETSEEDKSNWQWKKGVCVVKSCATRPGTTLVGPCSVCKHCQHAFDRGQDPTKLPTPKANKTTDITTRKIPKPMSENHTIPEGQHSKHKIERRVGSRILEAV